jgi:hypothetical protein
MASTQFGNLPTPAGNQKVAIPADMKALADALDTRITLLAQNLNDRQTRYADVPAGTEVVTPDGWKWVKIGPGPNDWYTVRSVEETTAFLWQGGWTDSGTSFIRRSGERYEMNVAANYSGATLGTGNIANQNICDLPAGWTPPDHRLTLLGVVAVSYGVGCLIASGTLSIVDTPTWSAGISDGQYINVYATWGV